MPIPVQPANIPPPQSAVSQFPNPAIAGQFERNAWTDLLSRVCDGPIPFGYGVVYGASQAEIALPAVSTDVTNAFQGVAVVRGEWEPVGPPGGPYSPQLRTGDVADVLAKGRVWAVCYGTLIDNGPVYCAYQTGGTSAVVGAFSGTSDANNALVPNAKCRVGTTGTPSSLALAFIEFASV